MKKLVAAMLVAASPLAAAKLGFNLDASGGATFEALASDSQISGQMLESDLGLAVEQGFYLSGSLEHPIPVIPNVRLHHKALVMSGTKTLSESFTYMGETIPAANVDTTLDLTHTDATLFWGVPLLPVIDVEFGLNTRLIHFGLQADLPQQLNDQGTADIDQSQLLPLPMLYLAGDANVPFVDLNVGFDYKTLPVGETNVSEWNVYARYYAPLPTNLLAKVGVEAGWRQFDMVIAQETLGQDTSSLASDVSIGGAYLGATFRF